MLVFLLVGSATIRTKFDRVVAVRADVTVCTPRTMKKIAPPYSLQSFKSLFAASLAIRLCDMLAERGFCALGGSAPVLS